MAREVAARAVAEGVFAREGGANEMDEGCGGGGWGEECACKEFDG